MIISITMAISIICIKNIHTEMNLPLQWSEHTCLYIAKNMQKITYIY